MNDTDRDTFIRTAAFERVRRPGEVHNHLTATEFQPLSGRHFFAGQF